MCVDAPLEGGERLRPEAVEIGAQRIERGQEAFPGSGHQTAQEEELRQLKRELERVRKARDILKKAVAIFSRS